MNKALVCLGSDMRGDDGIALHVGHLVDKKLTGWKIFFCGDNPDTQYESIALFKPDVIVVVDSISGFKDGVVKYIDLGTEKEYVTQSKSLPEPVLLKHLRGICKRTIYVGIYVLLENVIDFNEKLSSSAKMGAKIAFERIYRLDKELKS